MIYLQHEYLEFPGRPKPDNDYVGPFPHTDVAVQHRLVYGPVDSLIVNLPVSPPPEHVMSPGEAVDHLLARY